MYKKIFSEKCNLSSYTTIKVGGIAEYFAEPRNLEEFSNLIKWANLNKQRCQIIGAGSNLLINNIFIKGLVVCTKKLKSLKIEPCLLYTSPSPRDLARSRMPSSA